MEVKWKLVRQYEYRLFAKYACLVRKSSCPSIRPLTWLWIFIFQKILDILYFNYESGCIE